LTALILFLMSVTLDNRQLRSSLARPAPVVWAIVVNYGLIPLAAWPLSRLQLTPDFVVGLLVAASVPCTMAAASVWTRKAGGNDAIPLLVTLITNSLCFALTPLWLQWTLPAVEGGAVQLDTGYLMQKLIVSALLPITAGQLTRLVPLLAVAADRRKVLLGNLAQACILTIVFWESIKAGPKISTSGAGSAAAIALVWGTCILLHCGALAGSLIAARWFRFDVADQAAVAFAASQKTLPIGVYVAAAVSSAGAPLAVLPMLMYHASQLFIDTAVADRLAASGRTQDNSTHGDSLAETQRRTG
jgi:sodium/bile acid cotransporter 7